MSRKPKNRIEAALLHLAISMMVVGSVFLVVYFVWYPPPLFEGAGGRHLFLVLALVDVTIGPLITLVIYRLGKPGLRFDLAIIGVLQVAALAYGTHVVYEARPVWIVFAYDRFDLIRAHDVVPTSITRAADRFRSLSFTGPRIAAARQPADPNERLAISLSALKGTDITSFPHLYQDYAEVRPEAVARAKPVAELRALNPGKDAEVARLVADLGRPEAELAFLPLRAGKADLAMVIDARSGEVLRMSNLRPWKE